MTGLLASHPFRIWAMLVAVTLAGWFLAEGAGPARIASVAVILIAAFKINLVVGHFMELDWLPRPYRIVLTAWIVVASTIIIGGYLAA